MKVAMRTSVLVLALVAGLMAIASAAAAGSSKTYVGSERCGQCHQKEFENFARYAKKFHSYDNVAKMAPKLTSEELAGCFSCHTTGYGKPGGFISPDETPHLRDPGCEVCHGPGSDHVESEASEDLVAVTMEGCVTCHEKQRVAEFNFKPLIFGGAH